MAGNDVVCGMIFHEVEGEHRELEVRTALKEEDFVALGHSQQVAEVLFGLGEDIFEHFGAVAHFHYGHTAASVVEHFPGGFLQDLFGQHGGTG